MVECLPRKCRVLSSNSKTTKKKKKPLELLFESEIKEEKKMIKGIEVCRKSSHDKSVFL
jgi:hypothetical protein